MLFQTTFEPKLVAEASKELVFVLSQRKIRCVAISFFGVGGSGRRPLESAETSEELVFPLPQCKIRCATTSFFGFGGSGRRSLESC